MFGVPLVPKIAVGIHVIRERGVPSANSWSHPTPPNGKVQIVMYAAIRSPGT